MSRQPRSTMAMSHGASSMPSEIPTHRPSGEPIPTSEQLMQVDQAITLTLQDIDANFAKCHQIITGKILPSIRQYGIASHNTWQGAKFWHKFFETASDINLVPTYDEETEGEGSSQEPSYTSLRQEDNSALGESSLYSPALRGYHHGGGEELSEMAADETMRESESSGEFHERDLEPPRMSEASKAATQRHGKIDAPSWAPVESPYEKLKRDVDNDFSHAANDVHSDTAGPSRAKQKSVHGDIASTTPKAAKGGKLSTNLLRQQHEQLLRSARKVQATPKQSNPFTAGGWEAPDAGRKGNAERWNGIADLRKTPLAKIKGVPKNTKANILADDSMDSLPLPPGMSPPITMQFSMPQKKYNKTPAKMAANQAVNDLLHSIEVASPATRRKLLEKHLKESSSTRGNKVPLNNLTSTPLRKPIQKGRKSLPTPPTVTKRIGKSTLSKGAHGVDSPAGTSSAKLFDEDEAGDDLREEDEEVSPKLGTGMSRLALSRSPRGIDKLLNEEIDDEEDSSGEEDDSESDDEEEIGRGGSHSKASITTLQSALKRNGIGTDYPTGSSLASISRSIDQDTLFGIRDPNKNTSIGQIGHGNVTSQSRSVNVKGGQEAYQPKGARLYEQGTVYGGRPLLGDDREDTYSAPSPSPALAAAAAARKSK